MAGVNVNNPFQLDDPNAILASQNAGITANLAGQGRGTPLSQYGAGLGLMQMNGTGGGTGFSTASNFDMGRLMDVLKPYGITNMQQAQALATQLYNSIPPGAMPGQSANRFGTTTVGIGNLGDLSHTA